MSTPTSLELPAGVEVVRLETGRGTFAAQEARPERDTRGHLLLIPGFTGSKEDFTPILPLVAAAGWHVTAFDQRGQYETAGAPDDDYSLEGFAADALAVREAAAGGRSPSHLLGHSFGGLVAQSAVLAGPSAWLSLTLLCTGPAGFTEDARVKPLRAFIDAVPAQGLDAVFAVMQSKKERLPAPITQFLHGRFTGNSPVSITNIARRLLDAPDRLEQVGASGVPVQVVRGRDDGEWSPAVQAEMATRLGLEVVVIADSAHSPAVENPIATAETLTTFLASH